MSKIQDILTNITGLMNTAQAARYIGVTAGTLSVWRSTKLIKIPHIKIGSRVLYRQSDLDKFIEANTVRE